MEKYTFDCNTIEDNTLPRQTRSFRADADTISRFKAVAEQFPTQGECLKELITSYNLASAQQSFEESKKLIVDYRSGIAAIDEIFLKLIEEHHREYEENKRIKSESESWMKDKQDMETELRKLRADKERMGSYIDKLKKSGNSKNIGQTIVENKDQAERLRKLEEDYDELRQTLEEKDTVIAQLKAQLDEQKADFAKRERAYKDEAERKIFAIQKEAVESKNRMFDNFERISKILEEKQS